MTAEQLIKHRLQAEFDEQPLPPALTARLTALIESVPHEQGTSHRGSSRRELSAWLVAAAVVGIAVTTTLLITRNAPSSPQVASAPPVTNTAQLAAVSPRPPGSVDGGTTSGFSVNCGDLWTAPQATAGISTEPQWPASLSPHHSTPMTYRLTNSGESDLTTYITWRVVLLQDDVIVSRIGDANLVALPPVVVRAGSSVTSAVDVPPTGNCDNAQPLKPGQYSAVLYAHLTYVGKPATDVASEPADITIVG